MTKATRETSIHQLIHVPKTRKTKKKTKFEVTGYLARQVTQAHRKINQSKRRNKAGTMDLTSKARCAENSKWRQIRQARSRIFQAHYEIFQTFRCNRVQVGNKASNQWCLEVRDVVYREFSNGYRETLKFGHFNIL